MRSLSISGGATKLSALYGACKRLYELGYNPDVISGVSSGAIVSLFASINKFTIDEVIFNADLKDIFRVVPRVSIWGLIRLIFGNSIGNQSNLKKMIKRNFTESDFSRLVNSGKTVLIGATNYTTGKIVYYNLPEYSYREAIDIVYASACIPTMTEGAVICGDRHYDGGVIDHNPAPYVLSHYPIDMQVSVYSRPEEVEYSVYKGRKG